MTDRNWKALAGTGGVVLMRRPGEFWEPEYVKVQRRLGISNKTLQDLVGGSYESLRSGEMSVIVHGEGRLLDLTPCIGVRMPKGPPLVLVGPIVVVGNQLHKNGLTTFRGLTRDQMNLVANSHIWIELGRLGDEVKLKLPPPVPTFTICEVGTPRN